MRALIVLLLAAVLTIGCCGISMEKLEEYGIKLPGSSPPPTQYNASPTPPQQNYTAPPMHVCSDGTIVSNPSSCPVVPSSFVCPDGSKVSDASLCQTYTPPVTYNNTPEPPPATPPQNQSPPAPVNQTPAQPPQPTGPVCGDGVCTDPEHYTVCKDDCQVALKDFYSYKVGMVWGYVESFEVDGAPYNTFYQYAVSDGGLLTTLLGKEVYNGVRLRDCVAVIGLYGIPASPQSTGGVRQIFTLRDKATMQCKGIYTKEPTGSSSWAACNDPVSFKLLGTGVVSVPGGSFDSSNYELSYADGKKRLVWKPWGSINVEKVKGNPVRVPVKIVFNDTAPMEFDQELNASYVDELLSYEERAGFDYNDYRLALEEV